RRAGATAKDFWSAPQFKVGMRLTAITTAAVVLLGLGVWVVLKIVEQRTIAANIKARGQWFTAGWASAFNSVPELQQVKELTGTFAMLPAWGPLTRRPDLRQLRQQTKQLEQFKERLNAWWDQPALRAEDLQGLPLYQRVDFKIDFAG